MHWNWYLRYKRGNKKVAIKIQTLNSENENYINEEYKVLRDFSNHFNLPDYYSAYKREQNDISEIWFVMELCEGGPIIDLVNGLLERNRRMSEDHIAFILKEVVKALTYLHENLPSRYFGLSRHLSSTLGRTDTSIGSPSWMAPEVVTSSGDYNDEGYGNRADVWALGITAIELGDGKTPFCDMHPTRALFQIVRNPPPTLYRPCSWTDTYIDFISECLVKNPEYRPYMMEVLEHPFLIIVPENSYHLTQELKALRISIMEGSERPVKHNDAFVRSCLLKKCIDKTAERMDVEDLAALDYLTEDSILKELESRTTNGNFQTYIGDILLTLNPNEHQNIYTKEHHQKYSCKSRSANAPHIYAVADSAYQDALHHIIPQNIILTGESNSGKTTNYLHLMEHLLYLGESMNISMNRIKNGMKLIHWLTHASTPVNENSTRCALKTEVIYGRSGKVSGCTFSIYQLEKNRVTLSDSAHSNFHIFYYIHSGLIESGTAEKYHLSEEYDYKYLRKVENSQCSCTEKNVEKFKELQAIFDEYDFSKEQTDTIFSIISAILNIGEIKFQPLENDTASIQNEEQVAIVAALLKVEPKQLAWALVNYCYISKGAAVSKHHTCEEAADAANVFANSLYARIVDYIVSVINHKLSYGRAIFGEKYWIRILDMHGVECFKHNRLSQLLTNTLNEQLHYLYLQRVFAWEFLELNEESIPHTAIQYYDNRNAMEEILGKGGLLSIIDDTSKNDHRDRFITDCLDAKPNAHVKTENIDEFSITHFTGKITYQTTSMGKDNRDFLPPEVIDVLRLSDNPLVKMFFSNKLNKTGNLNVSFEEKTVKEKLSSSSSEEDDAYSQVRKMRSVASRFRTLCLELMKNLAVGGGSGGTHFVRCVRSDLENKPRNFHTEIVRQQLRAMAVIETAKARQKGYPHRITFSEFLRRYKFLAFDFNENVETTRDNCRLLLVRLKMEGWVIGKTKVFLKYYNEEYLARLYEVQVKKIVKIQCMMRSFLVKRKMAKRNQKDRKKSISQQHGQLEADAMTQEEAALIIQKAYRGLSVRRTDKPLVCQFSGVLDEETRDFIKPYADKWKSKSLFQVILQYRAVKQHELFNFAQQVHFFNQKCVHSLQSISNPIELGSVEVKAHASTWLQEIQPPVLKLPFRLDDVPYFDTTYMCDPVAVSGPAIEGEDAWDSPFQRRENVSSQIISSLLAEESLITKPYAQQVIRNESVEDDSIPTTEHVINMPFTRDPNEPIGKLSSTIIVSGELSPKRQISSPKPKRILQPTVEEVKEINESSSKTASPKKSHLKIQNPEIMESKESKNLENTITKTEIKKKEPAHPIEELKHLARRLSASEDDPPFNFQGMLRKTNFQRESLKRSVDNIRSRRTSKETNYFNKQKIISEIAPGVFLEGIVIDL
ncbi:Myosin head (motor domain) [Popillia japonica]|uniref:non-specific serine/threonine protein kinase n=1 Tax=Popillia japonica TaxID=7064 RepID=A0AAW1IE23_POPJA